MRVPDPTGKPGATKLVRKEKTDKVPYRPDIPAEYIAGIHAEPKAIEAAVKRLASGPSWAPARRSRRSTRSPPRP